jgi:hypothetical protein
MRSKAILAAAGVIACAATTNLNAQGIAFMPYAGYSLGGTLAEDEVNDITLKVKSALILGAQVELGLSKNIGLAVGVNRTLSQILESDFQGSIGEDDISMTQITGALVLRPGGRRPNGGVTPLYLEVGGGITMYKFGSAAASFTDFDANMTTFFAGAGYNIPVGPRATIQLFGRAQMISAYESDGLDAFNAAPPPTQVEGSSLINFQFGAGFRFGR